MAERTGGILNPPSVWRIGDATPVAVYCGGPTPCRRRLNIHRQCPKIGMQKPAYPTDCMLRGGNGRAHVPYHSHRVGAENCIGSHPQPALGAATRSGSIALGGSLNPPSVWRIGDGFGRACPRESGKLNAKQPADGLLQLIQNVLEYLKESFVIGPKDPFVGRHGLI